MKDFVLFCFHDLACLLFFFVCAKTCFHHLFASPMEPKAGHYNLQNGTLDFPIVLFVGAQQILTYIVLPLGAVPFAAWAAVLPPRGGGRDTAQPPGFGCFTSRLLRTSCSGSSSSSTGSSCSQRVPRANCSK